MSSVENKKIGGLKNFLLLRRRSIDKLKCSAYPILGSIFEKKSSLIHAFQNVLMNLSSRTEKTSRMSDIIIHAMQFLCLTMTSTLQLIRKHVGGVSLEKLEKRIHEFNQHKLKRKRSLSREIKKCNDIKDAISEERDEKFYDCLTAATITTTAETETSSVDIKSERLLKLSYGLCLAVVYTQLTMLLYMVGFCAFKLGFLFLLACVATIAYFVLKISFLKKANREHDRKGKRHCRVPSAHQIGKVITFCRPIVLVLPQIRFNISEKSLSTDCSGVKQKLL